MKKTVTILQSMAIWVQEEEEEADNNSECNILLRLWLHKKWNFPTGLFVKITVTVWIFNHEYFGLGTLNMTVTAYNFTSLTNIPIEQY